MSILLTPEQQQALDTSREDPPLIVDPRTNAAFVLLPADEYEAIREILEDERRLKAIRAVGLRNAAGRINEDVTRPCAK
ncbi:MAG TPA: hypothetical protein VMT52_16020 [Planctomycetota bacterium]|nr:hypothetical protein [Planctomycetota bacterium]